LDAYDSEKEQLEKIKKWWDTNGKAIIVGLTVGIGGIFGYRYWEDNKLLEGESASANYEHLLVVSQAGASDEATAAADALITNQPETFYAEMAALQSAKLAIDDNDYASAKRRLTWIIEQPNAGSLATIAKVRLAQLLLAQGSTEEAWTQFSSLQANDQMRFPEQHGDIALAQGNLELARAQYLIALEKADEYGIDMEPIQLKLDNMSFLQAQSQ
jgi:predicted negative regulator of RcsB-dependent stress response